MAIYTPSGNAQIDTAQAKIGSASGLFDGTGDYLTTPAQAGFNFGSGNFTIEFFVRFNSVADVQAFGGNYSDQSWILYFNAAGPTLQFAYNNGSTSIDTGMP